MIADRHKVRETFATHFGVVATMIGVAVGLGNVWRFPYMMWEFGGSAFVFVYIASVFFIGIPALMAEWSLGRHTGRGPLGAFARGGLPGGKAAGFLIFTVVAIALGYYSTAIGWVGYHALCEVLRAAGFEYNPSEILPPDSGFCAKSFFLQMTMTTLVVLGCGAVLLKGIKKGIERSSKIIIPVLFFILVALVIRSLTLEGSFRGLEWSFGRFSLSDLRASTVAAAMGQAIFSLSLGGSFMVIYGSYLDKKNNVLKDAIFTGLGDTIAGILAALIIIPAVAALNPGLGFEEASEIKGAKLLFVTLPQVFQRMPAGSIFGVLFFCGLFGAAFLSAIAAFEVLVGGLTDNTSLDRKKATALGCFAVVILSIPPSINMEIFIPWDLTFGSGMQVLGSLLAVVACVWCVNRSTMLAELGQGSRRPFPIWLYWWMRVVIPATIVLTGILWFRENVATSI